MSKFSGFHPSSANYSRLPHQLIEELHTFTSLAELKIVLYVLRHTWGYQDDYKRITLEEFEHGRKERDGTRIDEGVGMTKPSIIDGIKRAIEHGFLHSHTDETDNARVKKFYSLTESGLKSFTSEVKESDSSSKETSHRTEKETKERNSKKETKKDSSSLPEEAAPLISDKEIQSNILPIQKLETPIEEVTALEASATQLEEVPSAAVPIVKELDADLMAQLDFATTIIEEITGEAELDNQPQAAPEDTEIGAIITEAEEIVANKPKSLKKPRERDRIFDGVAKISFGIDAKLADDNPDIKMFLTTNGPRIGKITKWLKSLSVGVTPEMLWAFAKWYKAKFGGIDLPRDKDKFEEHFTAYLQTLADKPKSNFATAQKPPDESDMEPVDWDAENRKYEESKRERQKTNIPA